MPEPASYARGTKVPIDKSYSEIRDMLRKWGGDHFAFVEAPGINAIEFVIRDGEINLRVRITLPLPAPSDFQRDKNGSRRSETAAKSAYEAALRERWRNLVLIIKAKLASVTSGITTIEREFMPDIVMPDNQTVGYHVAETIKRAYETGQVPKLLPWSGGGE